MYAKSALKLFVTQTIGNTVRYKEFAGINANNTSTFAPSNQPLHATLFKCKHGLQLEDCAEKQEQKKEQWFLSESRRMRRTCTR